MSDSSADPALAETQPPPAPQRGSLRGDRGSDLAQASIAGFLVAAVAVLANLGALQAPLHGPDAALLGEGGALARMVTAPGAFAERPDAPLTLLGIGLNHAVPGEAAVTLRLVAVLLHAACAVLVFLAARRRLGPGAAEPVALCAGLLFAAHPLAAGATALAVARPLVQATAFGLLALLACTAAPGRAAGAGALLSFALAASSAWAWIALPALAWLLFARSSAVLWAAGAAALAAAAAQYPGAIGARLADIPGGIAEAAAQLAVLHAPAPAEPPFGFAARAIGIAAIAAMAAAQGSWRAALAFAAAFAVAGAAALLTAPPDDPARFYPALAVAALGAATAVQRTPAGALRTGAGAAVAAAVLAGMFLSYRHHLAWAEPPAYWQARAEAQAQTPEVWRWLAGAANSAAAAAQDPVERGAMAALAEQAWAQRGPDDAGALERRAQAALERNDAAGARALLLEALARDPGNGNAALQLALIDERASLPDPQRPETPMSELIERARSAADYFRHAQAHGALDAEAQLRYGMTLARLGNAEAALPLLEAAAAAGNAPPEATRALEMAKRTAQAVAAIDAKAAPGGETAPLQRLQQEAQRKLLRNELVPARYLLQQAMTLAPADPTPWVQLGLIALRTGGIGPFLDAHGAAMAQQPAAYSDLAARAAQIGAWDAARNALEFAAAHAPGAPPPLLRLAEIADALEDPARAEALLDEAARTQPGDPAPWLLRADRAIAAAQLDQAAAHLLEAETRGAPADALAPRRNQLGGAQPPTTPAIERTLIR